MSAILIRDAGQSPDPPNPGIVGAAALNNGVIPEPFSMAFMGSAFVGVVAYRLRRRRRMARKGE